METEFNNTQCCLNPLKLFVSMAVQTAIPYADLLEVTETYFITTQINLLILLQVANFWMCTWLHWL